LTRHASGVEVIINVMGHSRTEHALAAEGVTNQVTLSDQQFRLMADCAPVLLWMSGLDKGCTFFNKGWLEFTGRTMEQELGNGWAEGVHPDDLPKCLETYLSCFDARKSFQMEYRLRRHDGVYRWIIDHGTPVFADDGPFQGFIGSCVDITDRKLAEQSLAASQARLRAIVETAVDGIITIDARGTVHTINPAAERLFGVSAAEIVGRNVNVLMPEPDRSQHDQYIRNYLTTGVARIIGIGREVVGRRSDGSTFPMDLAVSEMRIDGERMFTGIVRDITDRKRAEQRQVFMMQELDHRVKNNLAAVLSIAEQTMSATTSLDQFRTAFTGRITALAHAHSALAASKWEGIELEELVHLTLEPYERRGSKRVHAEGPALRIPPEVASPLCMALHELATNAAKYGSLSAPQGRVEVRWTWLQDDGVRLQWQESGGPSVVTPQHRGFGTELIEGLISYELGGRSTIEYDPHGVKCEMAFAVPGPTSASRLAQAPAAAIALVKGGF
jgi:PAS domain S-box-containing protein